jgi:pyocin large subunit-like protein
MSKKNQKNSLFQKIVVAITALIIAVSGGTFYYDQTNNEADIANEQIQQAAEQEQQTVTDSQTVEEQYYFRSESLLEQHYEKHGQEMGFSSAKDYEKAASDVITNPDALHKTEQEDDDDVYYLEDTNEFVIVSTDGYIRTYFKPKDGIRYFNRQ